METRNQLIGRLLSSGKISANEAVTLLQNGEENETNGDKNWTPPAGNQRGLLTDIPHHSPMPIIPTAEPNINKVGKECKCTDCKCGANPK